MVFTLTRVATLPGQVLSGFGDQPPLLLFVCIFIYIFKKSFEPSFGGEVKRYINQLIVDIEIIDEDGNNHSLFVHIYFI